MKRLILLATLMVAVLASCEKHEIQNEVIQEIGFTQKLGKQTKAIAGTNNYLPEQPFGVYSYGWQNGAVTNKVMDNVEISSTGTTTEGTTTYTWKATTGKYYWPNDSRTTLNFYAYSPYASADATRPNHQKLTFATGEGNGVSHAEETGVKLTNYTHTNMYVDFMEATKVEGATYANPDGKEGTTNDVAGTVPMVFGHKFTQLNFNVSCSEYSGITFTIKEIKLVGIGSTATYNDGAWGTCTATTDYVVFPAKKYVSQSTNANGAPVITNTDAKTVTVTNGNESITDGADNTEDYFVVKNNSSNDKTSLNTTPITVIPQALTADSQYMLITYKIEGNGVATETVERKVYFRTNSYNLTSWDINMNITYKLVIGLNEIYFSPSIEDWSDVDGGTTTVQQ